MESSNPRNILVIKLSALGDFILSVGAFQAIRSHHAGDRLTLLTTQYFVGLAEACGCFDAIWVDDRPKLWRADQWLGLARRLRRASFDRVYDLQRSSRTGWYFRLAGRPEWVGSVAGCSHRYQMPQDRIEHICDREAAQLAQAGISSVSLPDLSFLSSDIGRFALTSPYALLVPGCAPHRPDKRWPTEHFASLGRSLAEHGMTPVLLGTRAEAAELAAIATSCPSVRNLCDATSLEDLASLARRAVLAVGNDTGPMHLIAATGCPSVVLYSAASDPAEGAPRGKQVSVLQEPHLKDLDPSRVLAALDSMVAS